MSYIAADRAQAYGKTSRTTFDDPYIQAVIQNSPYLANCLRPGAWLANSYPILRHLPYTLREPRKWSENEKELFRSNYENVRKNMVRLALSLHPT